MLIDENSSISILIIRLFHLIGVLINYFTLTNGKTQFLLAKLIDGVSFPVLRETKYVSARVSVEAEITHCGYCYVYRYVVRSICFVAYCIMQEINHTTGIGTSYTVRTLCRAQGRSCVTN